MPRAPKPLVMMVPSALMARSPEVEVLPSMPFAFVLVVAMVPAVVIVTFPLAARPFTPPLTLLISPVV